MKGIVFTEFIEMMEQEIGILECQKIMSSMELTKDGAYTAVGDYPFAELVCILLKFSDLLKKPVPKILFDFGGYFASSIQLQYRVFFDKSPTLFDFLESVHNHIHVEVVKLYPTARPPSLKVIERTENTIQLHYSSQRALGAFAEGLLYGVAKFYDTKIEVVTRGLDEAGAEVIFTIIVLDAV